ARGFDALYSRNLHDLVGAESGRLWERLTEATVHRRKIFHGQLTSRYLTRDDLLSHVTDARKWCEVLATSTLVEFGYDGFARDSFRKSHDPDLWKRFKVQLADIYD